MSDNHGFGRAQCLPVSTVLFPSNWWLTTLTAHILGDIALATHTDRRIRKQALLLAAPLYESAVCGHCGQSSGIVTPVWADIGGDQASDEQQKPGAGGSE